MADVLTAEQRRRNMQAIRERDTKPELIVRRNLHRLGYRFRLHRRDLPGRPDIVLPRLRTVILVHGCFWHQHPKCRYATRPATRTEFWNVKLDGNRVRDRVVRVCLSNLGWRVVVIWECETRNQESLKRKLCEVLKD